MKLVMVLYTWTRMKKYYYIIKNLKKYLVKNFKEDFLKKNLQISQFITRFKDDQTFLNEIQLKYRLREKNKDIKL